MDSPTISESAGHLPKEKNTHVDTHISLEEARKKRLCDTCRAQPVRRFKPGEPSTPEEKQLRKSLHCSSCMKRIEKPLNPVRIGNTGSKDDKDGV